MQSPSLAAGTGVLQDDADADPDLDAIDELLSQHSNQKALSHHASQAACSALDMDDPAGTGTPHSYNHLDRNQTGNARNKALAPAGPDTCDVIDLSCVSHPTPSRSSLHSGRSVHPQATCPAREAWQPSPSHIKKPANVASTEHGTSNR